MWYDSFKLFFKKLGNTFKLPKELLKREMNHDDINGDNYKDKKDFWLPFVKNDVLSTAYCYARYIKAMEEITGLSMEDFFVSTWFRMEIFQ